MSRSRALLPFAVLGLLLAPLASTAQDWQGTATLALRVTNDDGDPIADAKVLARLAQGNPDAGPAPVTTDASGGATIPGLVDGEWFVEVSHPGYMIFGAYVDLRAGKKPQVGFSSQVNTETSWTPMKVKFAKATPTFTRGSGVRKAEPSPPEVVREPSQPRETLPSEVVRPEPAGPPAQPEPRQPEVVRPEQPASDPAESADPAPEEAAAPAEPATPEPSIVETPTVEAPASEPVATDEAQTPAETPTETPAEPETGAPAVDEPAVDEPAVDEPAAAEVPAMPPAEPDLPDPVESPAAQDPAAEAPAVEAPAADAPAAEAPAAEAPTAEAPTVEAPAAESPVAEAPGADPPTADPPAVESPTAELPRDQPSAEEPDLPAPTPDVPAPDAPRREPAPEVPEADPGALPDPVDPPDAIPPADPEAPDDPEGLPTPPPAVETPVEPATDPMTEAGTPNAAPPPERDTTPPAPTTEPESGADTADQGASSVGAVPRYLRSAAAGTCSECEPGEWAVASEQPAARPDSTIDSRFCSESFVENAHEAARLLAETTAERLDGYAGPVLTALFRLPPSPERSRLQDLLGPLTDPESYCQLAGVVLPRSASYSGYVLEAWDSLGGRACRANVGCAVGMARWLDEPAVVEGSARVVVYSVFKNSSTRRERRARMTVYFQPPEPDWRPAR